MSDENKKADLLQKKQELEERLKKIQQDIAGGLNPDFSEQAVQLENRDVLLEIARVTEEELETIKKQLSKLDG